MTVDVLIVEDDETIRETTKLIVEMENLRVAAAKNGREALDFLEQADMPPRLILLDLNMPVMAGPEFFQRMRAADRPYSTTPTVVMTAVPGAKASPYNGLLKKPMDMDELLAVVHSFVSPSYEMPK